MKLLGKSFGNKTLAVGRIADQVYGIRIDQVK